jgi:hypothetical protein
MSLAQDLILHAVRAKADSTDCPESDFASALVLHQPRLARLVTRVTLSNAADDGDAEPG